MLTHSKKSITYTTFKQAEGQWDANFGL